LYFQNKDLTTEQLIVLAKQRLTSTLPTPGQRGKQENSVLDVKVCGCCLGSSSSDANEIVECDGCGISVHEVNEMSITLRISFLETITEKLMLMNGFICP